ncbi:MAG TPA: universal stress protein [Nitrospiria bacterium]|nr:universal stress protein [Nitrospiria bacterium]
MIPIKRILLATDFSDCSRAAIDYALAFAERLGAEVHLVHVFERPVYFEVGVSHRLQLGRDVDEWIRDLKADATKQLDALAAEVRGRKPGTQVSMREGLPVDEILLAAKALPADVIVLGTHGRTGLPHVLLGSVAERVVRGAPCPVLTVRLPVGARP